MSLLKWAGTGAYFGGIVLTSANIYPINLYLQAVGAGLWVLVALRVRDTPLLVAEALSLAAYGAGIVYAVMQWGSR